MSEELNCKYCGLVVHVGQREQLDSLEDIYHYECHIEYLEADTAQLEVYLDDERGKVRELEESLARSGALLADTEAKLDGAMAEANDLRQFIAGVRQGKE